MQTILECPVCYESFSASLRAVSLPCGHIFCEDDITRISSSENDRSACPICRQSFKFGGYSNNVHKLFLQSATNDTKPRPVYSALTADQQEEAQLLANQLRFMGLKATDSDVQFAFRNVRTWIGGLNYIGDIEAKTALYRLNLSLDHLSNRLVHTASLREEIKKARAESDAAKKELEELRLTHASMAHDFMQEIERSARESKKLRAMFETAKATVWQRQTSSESTDSTTQLHQVHADVSRKNKEKIREADLHLDHIVQPLPLISTILNTRRAHAKNSHNLDKQVTEDLSYRKGEIIKLVNKTQGQGAWWLGVLNGEFGCVPDHYIRIFSAPESSEIMYARAVKSFNKNRSVTEDLCFRRGDIIKLINKSEGTWRIGLLRGRVGYVPIQDVSPNSPANSPTNSPAK